MNIEYKHDFDKVIVVNEYGTKRELPNINNIKEILMNENKKEILLENSKYYKKKQRDVKLLLDTARSLEIAYITGTIVGTIIGILLFMVNNSSVEVLMFLKNSLIEVFPLIITYGIIGISSGIAAKKYKNENTKLEHLNEYFDNELYQVRQKIYCLKVNSSKVETPIIEKKINNLPNISLEDEIIDYYVSLENKIETITPDVENENKIIKPKTLKKVRK